jgi:hypothetical protein
MIPSESRDDVELEGIKVGCQQESITEDITQRANGRTLKAMGWNGIPDLLDGEVGYLKLVAIGIKQWLPRHLVGRSH